MRKISYEEVKDWWNEFNLVVFTECLRPPPRFHLLYGSGEQDLLGWVWAHEESARIDGIALNLGKHTSIPELQGTLIHEMVHQYEYEVLKLRGDSFNQHDRFDEWQDYLEVLGLPFNIMECCEYA